MPGNIVFKPIEAKLTHNTDLITKMSPYCVFAVGNERIKSNVCKSGGKNPHWYDTVIVPVNNSPECVVELMDKHRILPDENIGEFVVDLQEIEAKGNIKQWYAVYYKEEPVGEMLLEAVFTSDIHDLNQGKPLPNSDAMVDP